MLSDMSPSLPLLSFALPLTPSTSQQPWLLQGLPDLIIIIPLVSLCSTISRVCCCWCHWLSQKSRPATCWLLSSVLLSIKTSLSYIAADCWHPLLSLIKTSTHLIEADWPFVFSYQKINTIHRSGMADGRKRSRSSSLPGDFSPPKKSRILEESAGNKGVSPLIFCQAWKVQFLFIGSCGELSIAKKFQWMKTKPGRNSLPKSRLE